MLGNTRAELMLAAFHAIHLLEICAQAGCKELLQLCEPGNVNQSAQGPEPLFVASPARDGGAINRLPRLPLAGRFHGTLISFRMKTCVVPRQTAGGDDSPCD